MHALLYIGKSTAPPHLDLCQAMSSVSDQLSNAGGGLITCSPPSHSCQQVDCKILSFIPLSIALSCSPVGMILKTVNFTTSPPEAISQLFTQPGVFTDSIQVIIKNTTSDGVFLFALWGYDDHVTGKVLVNDTFIPTSSCSEEPKALDGECPSVRVAAVGFTKVT